MERINLLVRPDDLRRFCSPELFEFIDTSKIEPMDGFIGQEKAIDSLKFGLEIDKPGYNIFVCGPDGTGRASVIREYINKFIKEKEAVKLKDLRDFCYVYNFENSDKPNLLIFKRGDGRKFKKYIEESFSVLRMLIPIALQNREYLDKKEAILKECQNQVEIIQEDLRIKIRKDNFILTKEGKNTFVRPASLKLDDKNGLQPMPMEEFNGLEEGLKERITSSQQEISRLIEEIALQVSEFKEDVNEEIKNIEDKIIRRLAGSSLRIKKYRYSIGVDKFIKGLRSFITENADYFKTNQDNKPVGSGNDDLFLPFEVNLIVDNGKAESPPVIFEDNPTSVNLFGRIEKGFVAGTYVTDHTMIKAGSLCLADGGYLIMNLMDVFENFGVWGSLEKVLKSGSLEIEDPLEKFGFLRSLLNPEPMPINVKVIIIGEPDLYYLLAEHDEKFLDIFRVKAEFDSEISLDKNNIQNYARFVAQCCARENLLPFDPTGVSKIIENGIRMADDQNWKISTKFGLIKNLIVESDYWAKKSRSLLVKSEHVQRAVMEKRQRANLAERRARESIMEGMRLIDTDGKKIGQINALVVSDYGDFRFGGPEKITAKTFRGKDGLVSIQREVEVTGPIHDAGILILKGYFGHKYGQDKNLAFSASICFEQFYSSGLEGDSASAAELIVLLSSFSQVPIDQGISITGSINQNGEIQPIGGVNEKIEGFFDVCSERGLKGNQGVIIPWQNKRDLMLKEDVVDAVRRGEFKIYSINTIDDGLEILTGLPNEKIHKAVDQRLRSMIKKERKNLFSKIFQSKSQL